MMRATTQSTLAGRLVTAMDIVYALKRQGRTLYVPWKMPYFDFAEHLKPSNTQQKPSCKDAADMKENAAGQQCFMPARASGRPRLQPLAYWENERVVQANINGDVTVLGVVTTRDPFAKPEIVESSQSSTGGDSSWQGSSQ